MDEDPSRDRPVPLEDRPASPRGGNQSARLSRSLAGSISALTVRAGGSAFVAIREAFPKLRMLGGVDKRMLFKGSRELIDAELRRVEPVIRSGGFIPHIDHAVSQDISWKSFTYYRQQLDEMIDGTGG